MLTTSITLHRKAKDGTDGVGITSADVVFAQSKSNTNPPADSDVWKTNVKELTLVDGYLWSGTKIVYSNTKTAITGKYCIGSTRDYTDIEELYYLSDSGDKIPTNVTFQSSFKPEKGKYLWTCIRYRFKAASGAAENSNWVYSPPTCAGYFGDDGVSVKSSDVVFGIGTKTQQPTSWITNFSELVLVKGKYVWTCTKTILTSSSTPIYTGAYCLGECYDFAQVRELYALSDSSTNPPGMGNFTSSYKVVKGKYLWSCVEVTYSGGSIDYLNIRCVNYFPNDGVNGTKFTPKGTAYGHYEASSKMPKPSDDVLGLLYLVDKVDTLLTPINKPCVVWWRSFSDSSYMLSYDEAEEGDAYNIGGTLWVHDGKVWHDFGSVQGPKGDDGEDALNIELSTDRLLFRWEKENFSEQSASVTITARHGNTTIDASEYSVKISSTQNYKSDMAIISTTGKTYNLIIKTDGITMTEYVYNQEVVGGERKIKYPASSCAIKLSITYNGITYTKTIFIDVSFTKTYGDLTWNYECLEGEFGEFKTDVDGRFTQTASAISLKADAATLTNFKNEYDENGKAVNKRIGEIEVKYKEINISVGNINDGLKRTGINITDGSIAMTANKFTLYNNNGDKTFSADEYGNGVFKGTITATGGSFGSLQMTSYTDSTGFEFYGMHAHTAGTTMIASSTYTLDYQGLYVGTGLQNNGGSVRIGNNGRKTDGVFSWDNGVINVDADNSGVSNADISGIGVNVVGNSSHSAIGMKVSATGGKNNYAVDAENGDIRAQNGLFIGAFCGNVDKGNNGNNVTDNYTLQPTDSIIVCNNTKEIKITFPKKGIKAGQMFIVIAGTSSRINFGGEYGQVTSILCQTDPWCGTRGQWNYIIFDGNTWHLRMNWQG